MGVIVVGLDGSPGAQRALEFAVDEARFRKATLRIVHAWLMPLMLAAPGPILGGVPIDYGDTLEDQLEAARGAAERLLEDLVDRVPADGVVIERVLVEGQPTKALLEAAADADLLVVGSRGRGGFKGLVLGSVSQQCSGHAPCPVVIVPTRPEAHA
jgi:nucleotide-binding universal stress UspA family protein